MLIVFLISIIIILFCLLVLTIFKGAKAGDQLRAYDLFFEDTLSDVQEEIIFLNNLSKRDIMTLDPDVQKLRESILTLKNILIGYLNANKNKNYKKKAEKKESR